MSKTFSHEVHQSQAYYRMIGGTKIYDATAGKQVSYNIPRKMFDDLKRLGAIVFVADDEQGEDYYLSKNIKLVLSENILRIIGKSYGDRENQFFIRFAFSNGKAQLIKKAYERKGEKFKWFVKLYDNNLIGNEMLYTFDRENQLFIVDVIEVYLRNK